MIHISEPESSSSLSEEMVTLTFSGMNTKSQMLKHPRKRLELHCRRAFLRKYEISRSVDGCHRQREAILMP